MPLRLLMNCLVAYRMEPEVFKSVASFLRIENSVRDTRGVRVEVKLAMFILPVNQTHWKITSNPRFFTYFKMLPLYFTI
uniref:DUF8040 domain-containing protein n=1 Tax=Leersia perrieri TaxID=77586 RepID=A0A0D9UXP8_9ORYZ